MKKITAFITALAFSLISFGLNSQYNMYNDINADNSVVYAAEDLSGYTDKVVFLVNQERAKNGLSPLKTANVLTEMANVRSKELATKFSHTRPNGQSGMKIIDSYNLKYWAAGENIAAGYSTPEEVVQGWMNSSGHRANILNGNYEYIGVGLYSAEKDLYGTYWTQLFYKLDKPLDGEYIPSDNLTGDVNSDGVVSSQDALAVLQWVVSENKTKDNRYDINNDGIVDSSDALRLLQYITGIIDKL